MQERDLATENDTARLVIFDEAEGLSVEDEMLLSEILQIFRGNCEKINVNFKTANQQQLKEMIEEVNKIIDKITANTIAETKDLVYAVSNNAAKKLGIKTCKRRPMNEP